MIKKSIVCALLFLVACASSRVAAPAFSEVRLERGACFGSCPIYVLTVYGNGNAIFVGEKNIPRIGRYQKRITAAQLDSIALAFERAKFFDLQNEYKRLTTDLPLTEISYKSPRNIKTVVNLGGAPEAFIKLAQAIDQFAGEDGWEKLDK